MPSSKKATGKDRKQTVSSIRKKKYVGGTLYSQSDIIKLLCTTVRNLVKNKKRSEKTYEALKLVGLTDKETFTHDDMTELRDMSKNEYLFTEKEGSIVPLTDSISLKPIKCKDAIFLNSIENGHNAIYTWGEISDMSETQQFDIFDVFSLEAWFQRNNTHPTTRKEIPVNIITTVNLISSLNRYSTTEEKKTDYPTIITSFLTMIEEDNREYILKYIKYGIPSNIVIKGFILACKINNTSMVELILELATTNNMLDVVYTIDNKEYTIKQEREPLKLTNNDIHQALQEAVSASYESVDVVHLLLTHPSLKTFRDTLTFLHNIPFYLQLVVMNHGNIHMFRELLQLAKTKIQPSDLGYLLRTAASNGYEEIVYELLKPEYSPKSFIDLKGRAGYTALMYAVNGRNIGTIEALLRAGADISGIDTRSLTKEIKDLLDREIKYRNEEERARFEEAQAINRPTSPAQEGGARITYQGKSYKLCTEKDTGKKYITVGKEKTRVYVRTSSKGKLSFRKA